MADLRARLTDCFVLVFPELSRQEAALVSMGSLASWDSVAGITLLTVIEEEFGVSVSPDDVMGLVSFELVLDYLERSLSASRS